MLLSHLHKFIYTKTLKTGSTSVEAYFERYCMPEGSWTLSDTRAELISDAGIVGFRGAEMPIACKWWNHMPADSIRQHVGPEVWHGYRKFCVIRNPFDKAISSYYFAQYLHTGQVVFEGILREREKFEIWLGDGSRLPIDRDKYIIDGEFCLDHVVRYESLADDLALVCSHLGVAWQPALLPSLKAGIRPAQATAQALFTDRTRRLVEAAYAFEFDHFEYSFPESVTSAS